VTIPAAPHLHAVAGPERPPRRIGMVLHPEHDAMPVLEAVRASVRRTGTTVVVPSDASARNQLAADSDLLIAAGGDGTVLEAMRLAEPHDIPVLGVNLGRLGYLTELDFGQLGRGLDAVGRGDFSLEPHTALTVHLERGGPLMAFNDVVVSRRRGRSEAMLALHVDGELFTRHAGDGLIVSSAAGSTAYSFSAGGPILSPRLAAVLVTPLAPHAAFSRSLVLAPNERVTLVVLCGSSALAVEIDGRENVELPPGARLSVEAAPNAVHLVRLGYVGFAARAQMRLGAHEALEIGSGRAAQLGRH
jgi:NAD+ kinase